MKCNILHVLETSAPFKEKHSDHCEDLDKLKLLTNFITVFELVCCCKIQKLEHKRHVIRHSYDSVTITLAFEVERIS